MFSFANNILTMPAVRFIHASLFSIIFLCAFTPNSAEAVLKKASDQHRLGHIQPNVSINSSDRGVFDELLTPLHRYIDTLNASNQAAVSTLHELMKIRAPGTDLKPQAFNAQYTVSFFDQYSLQGTANKSMQLNCDRITSKTQLELKSLDKELTIKSFFEENQALDAQTADYRSNYFYQVSADKVNVNQKVEGHFKRAATALQHHQQLPYTIDASHDANALFLYQVLSYKLDALQTLKKSPTETVSFSFISVPEDVESSEVLNLVEASYKGLVLDESSILATYLLSIKHYLRDGKGGWLDDGHSIEWLSSSGVSLYESFLMPSGLSMQYSLDSVNLLKPANCE